MEGTTGGEGSGLQQREPALVLEQDGCGQPLLFIADDASDDQLSFLLPMEAYTGEMMIVLPSDMGRTVSIVNTVVFKGCSEVQDFHIVEGQSLGVSQVAGQILFKVSGELVVRCVEGKNEIRMFLQPGM